MTKATQNFAQTGSLSDADLDQVSGGLNPQPLPPKESFKLFSSFSFLKVLPSFSLPSFFRF
ncbi:hypothetical protein OPKNFCMD_5496 [Methylobacterium crusticola]|uniref:Bacteriocin n=1 Tax=Methylobacterium crusticola TaxID=1697972 RepID=A0ABQ4R7E5_9HYPH|nr:hypothetical protein [Methylobacterium crusticola]GJD52729.1 hypothetical protein OPKNFCMD_5496 [Methylobacterium crusticola]